MTDSVRSEREIFLVKQAHVRIAISGNYPLGCLPLEISQSQDPEGLEVNAILVGEGKSALLFISIDSLYIGPKIRTYCERIFRGHLAPHQIFLSASHTHNAPGLDDTKPGLAAHSTEFLDATQEAILEVQYKLECSGWKEATLAVNNFFPKEIVRRRMKPPAWMVKIGLLGSDYLQLPDSDAAPAVSSTTLAFWAAGELLGCICIYPCHPVAYPSKSEVSPDFIGSFRKAVRREEENRKSLVVPSFVFMQGASGDLRPASSPARRLSGVRDLFFRLFVGVAFGRFEQERWESWSRERSQEVLSAIYSQNKVSVSSRNLPVTAARIEVPLREICVGKGDQTRSFSVHSVTFGDLKIVGVSSEISWGISEELSQVLPGKFMYVFVGCIDDTFGYTPSASQLAEGGYEVDGWIPSFGLSPAIPVAERLRRIKELMILVAK